MERSTEAGLDERTGAPRSPQRTWEDNDFFPLLFPGQVTKSLSSKPFLIGVAKALEGLRPIFSSHVRWGERGAPVRSTTFSLMKHRFARAAGYLVILLTSLWAAMALAIDLRIIAAVAYGLAILLILFLLRTRPLRLLLACLLGCALVLAWWLTLKPSNEGHWQADVSRTAWAEVQGGEVTIHNLRDCDYRTELDYTCQWLTRTVDLNQIEGVDLFMNYWGSPLIAHTILSFDLRGADHVAFSIETRKQMGQPYSALLGFFRQYTLISVVSDERDVVRLRTNYRHGENLYLFHTAATPQFARSLFVNYIGLNVSVRATARLIGVRPIDYVVSSCERPERLESAGREI